MKIVFLDQLGCYAAVVAASLGADLLHNGMTPLDISNLPHFADHKGFHAGNLYRIGNDKERNEYYALGVGSEGTAMAVSALDLLELMDFQWNKNKGIQFIDVSSFNTVPIKILWYLSLFKPFQRIALLQAAAVLKKKIPQMQEMVKILSGKND